MPFSLPGMPICSFITPSVSASNTSLCCTLSPYLFPSQAKKLIKGYSVHLYPKAKEVPGTYNR